MMLRTSHLIGLLVLASLSAATYADPPGRVGRISEVQGAVTFRLASYSDTQAMLNWPITSDNELLTDRGARAEFRIGATAIRLDSDSDLAILQLDDNHVRLRLQHGSIQLHLRGARLARDIELDTPQGRLLFSEGSNVRIESRDDSGVTVMNVATGAVSFDGGITRFTVNAGRRAEVDASGLRVLESRDNFRDDEFDAWNTLRDRQDAQTTTSRYVSSEMTGYEVLDSYGVWRTTSAYGPLWSPTVIPAGWAPYRDGRWTWIAPWGWTWIDNAPWAYAPSHYGRWVFHEQRWCWTPGGALAQPVWAPALVGWIGGAGWQAAASSGPAIGWFPLAPREVYVPAYQATPRYVQQLNNAALNNGALPSQIYTGNGQRAALYQNQQVRNAVTTLPSYQFGTSKTVIVAPSTLPAHQAQRMSTRSTAATPSVAPAALTRPLTASTSPTLSAPPPRAPATQTHSQALISPVTRSDRASGQIVVAPPVLPAPSHAVSNAPLAIQSQAVLVQRQPSQATTAVSPASRREAESTQVPLEQRRSARLGGSNPPDSAVSREGFGRGLLQR